ncbi:MAG TPA: copper transporter [Streptosporangiaceae bacterium]|nr:copper transporter [Streptosporangiaceae bacterium]
MIDFRYHLVSIIAVFLALAVGIVVGAEAVSPKFANSLNKEAHIAEKRNSVLNAQNNQLKRQIAADGAFAQAAEGYLVKDLLVGERVLLVTAPGADGGTVSGVTSALTKSGAVVTGTISLSPKFFDADATTEATLTETAGQFAPSGLSISDTAGDLLAGQQAAAKVIAAGVMDKFGLPTLPVKQTNSILTGFGAQGFLQTSTANGGTALLGQATLAVVVAPGNTPANADPLSAENRALIYLTRDLNLAGKGALLAGSLAGSGNGSAIDAVTSGGADVAVTTVDNADTVTGQIITVQALHRLTGPDAAPTAYGVGPGSAPSPAPTSSPTPSSTPSKPAKKKTVKR